MPADPRKARDHALLDAIDDFLRHPVTQSVWRVVREGRDPLAGATSRSRWCNDTFDVLYASYERNGAISEIFALLNTQPVFPHKVPFFVHSIRVRASEMLYLPDLATLEKLGINTARYGNRSYQRSQEIADAAYFLGFQGLVAPSARSSSLIMVVFTERVSPSDLQLEQSDATPVNWEAWRKASSRS